MNINFGRVVEKLRRKAGLTQTELAKLAGMSHQNIDAIENGAIPKMDTLYKLAQALNVTVSQLYEETGFNIQATEIKEKGNRPYNILSDLEVILNAYIPVLPEVSAGPGSEPVDYIATTSRRVVPTNLRAYKVKGYCQSPLIDEGDLIVVDNERQWTDGDLILCRIGNELSIKKLKVKPDKSKVLVNNYGEIQPENCMNMGIIVQVIKNIRH